MYLTHPSLNRPDHSRTGALRSHRISNSVLALVFATMATACTPSPTTHPRPTKAPPELLPPAPISLPEKRSESLLPDSTEYILSATVVTTQDTPASGVTDSFTVREIVRARFRPRPQDQVILLELTSDSGYMLPQGRSLPPELLARDTLPATAAATLTWSSQGETRLAGALETSCTALPTLLSDLLAAIYLRQLAASPRLGAPTSPTADSLQYRTCTAGVLTAYRTAITPSASSVGHLIISGVADSDSSITLPMRVHTDFRGNATVSIDTTSTSSLPLELQLDLMGRIEAQSDQRAQLFRQRSYIRMTRRQSNP